MGWLSKNFGSLAPLTNTVTAPVDLASRALTGQGVLDNLGELGTNAYGTITGATDAKRGMEAQLAANQQAQTTLGTGNQDILALLAKQYEAQNAVMSPYVNAGPAALPQMTALSGQTVPTYQGQVFDPLAPGQLSAAGQYQLQQGNTALNRQLAARGMAGGGLAANKLANLASSVYAQDYGNQFDRAVTGYGLNQQNAMNQYQSAMSAYQQPYERWSALANMGYGAANQSAQIASNYGQQYAGQAGDYWTKLAQLQSGQGDISGSYYAGRGAMPLQLLSTGIQAAGAVSGFAGAGNPATAKKPLTAQV